MRKILGIATSGFALGFVLSVPFFWLLHTPQFQVSIILAVLLPAIFAALLAALVALILWQFFKPDNPEIVRGFLWGIGLYFGLTIGLFIIVDLSIGPHFLEPY